MGRAILLRLVEILRAPDAPAAGVPVLSLAHDARHVRRRVLELEDGRRILIDLSEPTVLHHGDTLVLEDGGRVLVQAAEEELFDIRARDAVHLLELAWHIGNRHLGAEIREDRILILRDHVIRTMLEQLGATVRDIRAPFVPVRGAYSAESGGHRHSHAQGDHHHHDHGHSHG